MAMSKASVWSVLDQQDHSPSDVLSAISAGADPNERRWWTGNATPLHHCARYNLIEDMRVLLDNGADPSLKNDMNLTPADMGRVYRNHDVESIVESYMGNQAEDSDDDDDDDEDEVGDDESEVAPIRETAPPQHQNFFTKRLKGILGSSTTSLPPAEATNRPNTAIPNAARDPHNSSLRPVSANVPAPKTSKKKKMKKSGRRIVPQVHVSEEDGSTSVVAPSPNPLVELSHRTPPPVDRSGRLEAGMLTPYQIGLGANTPMPHPPQSPPHEINFRQQLGNLGKEQFNPAATGDLPVLHDRNVHGEPKSFQTQPRNETDEQHHVPTSNIRKRHNDVVEWFLGLGGAGKSIIVIAILVMLGLCGAVGYLVYHSELPPVTNLDGRDIVADSITIDDIHSTNISSTAVHANDVHASDVQARQIETDSLGANSIEVRHISISSTMATVSSATAQGSGTGTGSGTAAAVHPGLEKLATMAAGSVPSGEGDMGVPYDASGLLGLDINAAGTMVADQVVATDSLYVGASVHVGEEVLASSLQVEDRITSGVVEASELVTSTLQVSGDVTVDGSAVINGEQTVPRATVTEHLAVEGSMDVNNVFATDTQTGLNVSSDLHVYGKLYAHGALEFAPTNDSEVPVLTLPNWRAANMHSNASSTYTVDVGEQEETAVQFKVDPTADTVLTMGSTEDKSTVRTMELSLKRTNELPVNVSVGLTARLQDALLLGWWPLEELSFDGESVSSPDMSSFGSAATASESENPGIYTMEYSEHTGTSTVRVRGTDLNVQQNILSTDAHWATVKEKSSLSLSIWWRWIPGLTPPEDATHYNVFTIYSTNEFPGIPVAGIQLVRVEDTIATVVITGTYRLSDGTSRSIAGEEVALRAGAWVHTTLVMDGSRQDVRLYHNGVLSSEVEVTRNYPTEIDVAGASVTFGGLPRVTANDTSVDSLAAFQGQLWNAQVFQSRLLDNDVEALYNNVKYAGTDELVLKNENNGRKAIQLLAGLGGITVQGNTMALQSTSKMSLASGAGGTSMTSDGFVTISSSEADVSMQSPRRIDMDAGAVVSIESEGDLELVARPASGTQSEMNVGISSRTADAALNVFSAGDSSEAISISAEWGGMSISAEDDIRMASSTLRVESQSGVHVESSGDVSTTARLGSRISATTTGSISLSTTATSEVEAWIKAMCVVISPGKSHTASIGTSYCQDEVGSPNTVFVEIAEISYCCSEEQPEDLSAHALEATEATNAARIEVASASNANNAVELSAVNGGISITSLGSGLSVASGGESPLTVSHDGSDAIFEIVDGSLQLSGSNHTGDSVAIEARGEGGMKLAVAGNGDMDISAELGKLNLHAPEDGFHIMGSGNTSSITVVATDDDQDLRIAVEGSTQSSLMLVGGGETNDAVKLEAIRGGIEMYARDRLYSNSDVIDLDATVDVTIDAGQSVWIRAHGEQSGYEVYSQSDGDSLLLRQVGQTVEAGVHVFAEGTGVDAVKLEAENGGIHMTSLASTDIESGASVTVHAADDVSISADDAVSIAANGVAGNPAALRVALESGTLPNQGMEIVSEARHSEQALSIHTTAEGGDMNIDSEKGTMSIHARDTVSVSSTNTNVEIDALQGLVSLQADTYNATTVSRMHMESTTSGLDVLTKANTSLRMNPYNSDETFEISVNGAVRSQLLVHAEGTQEGSLRMEATSSLGSIQIYSEGADDESAITVEAANGGITLTSVDQIMVSGDDSVKLQSGAQSVTVDGAVSIVSSTTGEFNATDSIAMHSNDIHLDGEQSVQLVSGGTANITVSRDTVEISGTTLNEEWDTVEISSANSEIVMDGTGFRAHTTGPNGMVLESDRKVLLSADQNVFVHSQASIRMKTFDEISLSTDMWADEQAANPNVTLVPPTIGIHSNGYVTVESDLNTTMKAASAEILIGEHFQLSSNDTIEISADGSLEQSAEDITLRATNGINVHSTDALIQAGDSVRVSAGVDIDVQATATISQTAGTTMSIAAEDVAISATNDMVTTAPTISLSSENYTSSASNAHSEVAEKFSVTVDGTAMLKMTNESTTLQLTGADQRLSVEATGAIELTSSDTISVSSAQGTTVATQSTLTLESQGDMDISSTSGELQLSSGSNMGMHSTATMTLSSDDELSVDSTTHVKVGTDATAAGSPVSIGASTRDTQHAAKVFSVDADSSIGLTAQGPISVHAQSGNVSIEASDSVNVVSDTTTYLKSAGSTDIETDELIISSSVTTVTVQNQTTSGNNILSTATETFSVTVDGTSTFLMTNESTKLQLTGADQELELESTGAMGFASSDSITLTSAQGTTLDTPSTINIEAGGNVDISSISGEVQLGSGGNMEIHSAGELSLTGDGVVDIDSNTEVKIGANAAAVGSPISIGAISRDTQHTAKVFSVNADTSIGLTAQGPINAHAQSGNVSIEGSDSVNVVSDTTTYLKSSGSTEIETDEYILSSASVSVAADELSNVVDNSYETSVGGVTSISMTPTEISLAVAAGGQRVRVTSSGSIETVSDGNTTIASSGSTVVDSTDQVVVEAANDVQVTSGQGNIYVTAHTHMDTTSMGTMNVTSGDDLLVDSLTNIHIGTDSGANGTSISIGALSRDVEVAAEALSFETAAGIDVVAGESVSFSVPSGNMSATVSDTIEMMSGEHTKIGSTVKTDLVSETMVVTVDSLTTDADTVATNADSEIALAVDSTSSMEITPDTITLSVTTAGSSLGIGSAGTVSISSSDDVSIDTQSTFSTTTQGDIELTASQNLVLESTSASASLSALSRVGIDSMVVDIQALEDTIVDAQESIMIGTNAAYNESNVVMGASTREVTLNASTAVIDASEDATVSAANALNLNADTMTFEADSSIGMESAVIDINTEANPAGQVNIGHATVDVSLTTNTWSTHSTGSISITGLAGASVEAMDAVDISSSDEVKLASVDGRATIRVVHGNGEVRVNSDDLTVTSTSTTFDVTDITVDASNDILLEGSNSVTIDSLNDVLIGTGLNGLTSDVNIGATTRPLQLSGSTVSVDGTTQYSLSSAAIDMTSTGSYDMSAETISLTGGQSISVSSPTVEINTAANPGGVVEIGHGSVNVTTKAQYLETTAVEAITILGDSTGYIKTEDRIDIVSGTTVALKPEDDNALVRVVNGTGEVKLQGATVIIDADDVSLDVTDYALAATGTVSVEGVTSTTIDSTNLVNIGTGAEGPTSNVRVGALTRPVEVSGLSVAMEAATTMSLNVATDLTADADNMDLTAVDTLSILGENVKISTTNNVNGTIQIGHTSRTLSLRSSWGRLTTAEEFNATIGHSLRLASGTNMYLTSGEDMFIQTVAGDAVLTLVDDTGALSAEGITVSVSATGDLTMHGEDLVEIETGNGGSINIGAEPFTAPIEIGTSLTARTISIGSTESTTVAVTGKTLTSTSSVKTAIASTANVEITSELGLVELDGAEIEIGKSYSDTITIGSSAATTSIDVTANAIQIKGEDALEIIGEGATGVSIESRGGAPTIIGGDAQNGRIEIGTGNAPRTISIGHAISALTSVVSVDVSLNAGDVLALASDNTIDIDAVHGITVDSSSGSINIGTEAHSGAINIGSSATSRTITMGNLLSSEAFVKARVVDITNGIASLTLTELEGAKLLADEGVAIDSESGPIEIGAGPYAQPIYIGSGSSSRTITIGSNDATSLLLQAESVQMLSENTMEIDSGSSLEINANSGGTISMGSNTNAGSILIGTGIVGRDILIGQTIGTSVQIVSKAVSLEATTGTLSLSGNDIAFSSDGEITMEATGDVSIGTNSQTTAVSIGNTDAAVTLIEGISVTVNGDSAVSVNSQGDIHVSATDDVNMDSSAGSINIGTATHATTINIGTSATGREINVGNFASSGLNLKASDVAVTSNGDLVLLSNGAGDLTIDSDSGRIQLDSSSAIEIGAEVASAAGRTVVIGTTSIAGTTLQGGEVTISAGASGASVTSANELVIEADENVEIDSVNGDIVLGGGSDTGSIMIGSSNTARTLTIGTTSSTLIGLTAQTITTTASSSLSMTSTAGTVSISGVGIVSIDSTLGSINIGTALHNTPINIGTSATARVITLGNAASQAVNVYGEDVTLDADITLTLESGSGGVFVNSRGGGAGSINIGTDDQTDAVNIGTGTSARLVTIGNSNTPSLALVSRGLTMTMSEAVTLDSGESVDIQADEDVAINSVTGDLKLGNGAHPGSVYIATSNTARSVYLGHLTNVEMALRSTYLSVQTADNIDITAGQALSISADDGTISLEAVNGGIYIGTNSEAEPIEIGTGNAAKAISLGSTSSTSITMETIAGSFTSSTTLTLHSGSSTLSLDGTGGGNINIGTGSYIGNINIGTSDTARAIEIGSSSSASMDLESSGAMSLQSHAGSFTVAALDTITMTVSDPAGVIDIGGDSQGVIKIGYHANNDEIRIGSSGSTGVMLGRSMLLRSYALDANLESVSAGVVIKAGTDVELIAQGGDILIGNDVNTGTVKVGTLGARDVLIGSSAATSLQLTSVDTTMSADGDLVVQGGTSASFGSLGGDVIVGGESVPGQNVKIGYVATNKNILIGTSSTTATTIFSNGITLNAGGAAEVYGSTVTVSGSTSASIQATAGTVAIGTTGTVSTMTIGSAVDSSIVIGALGTTSMTIQSAEVQCSSSGEFTIDTTAGDISIGGGDGNSNAMYIGTGDSARAIYIGHASNALLQLSADRIELTSASNLDITQTAGTMSVVGANALSLESLAGAVSIGRGAGTGDVLIGMASRSVYIGDVLSPDVQVDAVAVAINGATSVDVTTETFQVTATTINVDTQPGGGLNLGTNSDSSPVNVATSATARTIAIGHASSTSLSMAAGVVSIASGGGFTMNAGSSVTLSNSNGNFDIAGGSIVQTVTLGAGAAAKTVTIGSHAAALVSVKADTDIELDSLGDVTIDGGSAIAITAGTTLALETSLSSIDIGASASTGNINIGTGAVSRTVTIGRNGMGTINARASTVNIEASTSFQLSGSGAAVISADAGVSIYSSTSVSIATNIDNSPVYMATSGSRTVTIGSASQTAMTLRGSSIDVVASTVSLESTTGELTIEADTNLKMDAGGEIQIGTTSGTQDKIRLGYLGNRFIEIGNLGSAVLYIQPTPVTKSTISYTLTSSELADGLIVGSPIGSQTYSLPAATTLRSYIGDASGSSVRTGASLFVSFVNTGSGTITLNAGFGGSEVGNMEVASSASGRFMIRMTGSSSYIVYRVT